MYHTHMRSLERATRFEWDAGSSRKSADKHDVSRAETEQVFLNEPLVVLADLAHSRAEARFHALGRTDGARLLHATFTLREDGARIRVISARPMHRKERRLSEEAP